MGYCYRCPTINNNSGRITAAADPTYLYKSNYHNSFDITSYLKNPDALSCSLFKNADRDNLWNT